MKKIALLLIAAVSVVLTTACDDDDSKTVEKVLTVNGVSLNATMLTLTVNSTANLEATVKPENAPNKAVTWTTSDPAVATVNDGEVTAVGEGNATITVTTQEGEKTAHCVVTAYIPPTPVTGIELAQTAITLEKGATTELAANVLPTDATNQGIKWATSDAKVATVTEGVVTAVGVGKATITATTREGAFAKDCEVEVIISITGVTLDKTDIQIINGKTETLKATILPEDYSVTEESIVWSSDKPAIADVDQDGVVTAKSLGTAIITVTVTTEDGKVFDDECEVKVIADFDEVYLELGDDLKEAMENPTSKGKTIRLPIGYTYTWDATIGTITPVPDVTIYGDPNGDRALFNISINTPISLNQVEAEHIKFENCAFVTTGQYFINQGTNEADNACDIGILSFENCTFTDFGRSVVRAQRPGQRFDVVQFNNCIINNGGSETNQNYALVQTASGATHQAFGSIIITNTTVNGHGSDFLSIVGGAGSPGTSSAGSVLIENCTFYKTVGSNSTPPNARYFINAGTNGPTDITVRNCIFGSVRGVGNEGGYVAHEESTFISTGNYSTTDWVTTPPDIPSLILYSGNCAALFVDPENGDFRIKDDTFAGKDAAGDPRWR